MVADAGARVQRAPRRSIPGPPPGHVTSLLSIGQLAGAEADPTEQAGQALASLRTIIPFQAASIAAWDPLAREHRTTVNFGYPEAVADYLDDRFIRDDELYRIMRTRDPLPLRWQDVPFDYRERYSAASVFIPAGFDEGTSVLLLRDDGRYTGVLHISVDSAPNLSDEAMTSLAWLQGLLAPVVDEIGSWSRLVHQLSPGASATLIAASGGSTFDMPGHEWAWSPEEQRALVAAVLDHWLTSSGCSVRHLWRSPRGRWFSVWMQGLHSDVLAVGEELPQGPPYGLTDREMAVVAGVSAGRSNQQLARALSVSARTVAKHVENIMTKTAATSRTDLCALAHREGFVSLGRAGADGRA